QAYDRTGKDIATWGRNCECDRFTLRPNTTHPVAKQRQALPSSERAGKLDGLLTATGRTRTSISYCRGLVFGERIAKSENRLGRKQMVRGSHDLKHRIPVVGQFRDRDRRPIEIVSTKYETAAALA